METKTYTRQELKDFIQSDFFYALTIIPISKYRALSQINNPRASDNDILLAVQYDKNEVVGYLGILPDYLFVNNQKEKMGWLTCFWVDENYKSKNVAANLFLRVIRAWDQRILITNIVPWLEPVYQKTNIFQPTIYKIGFRGYLRFNFADILPPRKAIFKRVKPLLSLTDAILNIFNDIRLLFFKQFSFEDINYEYLTCLDDESDKFIEKFIQKSWPQRGRNEIDWIINNHWIVQGGNNDFNSKRYYFSSLNKRFFYQTVKFLGPDKKIIGIVILSIRENNLSIPYVFSEPATMDGISKHLVNTMLNLRLSMITTFNEELIGSLKTIKTPFFFKKRIKKPYFISKKFSNINSLKFQDGDGDCAFY